MRISEMKPNTEYATCDGMLVMTGDTVERGWYVYSEVVTKENGERHRVTRQGKGDPRKAADRPDPWANCKPSGREGVQIHTHNGMRVTQWGFDRTGKRLADGLSSVLIMKPDDIPGLWSDYVLLHGDDIEYKFARKDLEDEAAAWRIDTRETLKALGFSVDDGRNPSSAAKRKGNIYVSATVQDDTEYVGGRYVRKGPSYIVRDIDFPQDQAERILEILKAQVPAVES